MEVENWETYLICKGYPLKREGSQPGAPVLVRRTPQYLAMKINGDLSIQVKLKATYNLGILLQGLHIDLLSCKHSPRLQRRDSSWVGARDIQGDTQLCGFSVTTRRRATVVPLLSCLPHNWQHLSHVEYSPTCIILNLC